MKPLSLPARELSLLSTAAAWVRIHPGRSLVVVLYLLALLTPLVAGLALEAGLRSQALASLDAGPGVVVREIRAGSPAPMDRALGDEVRRLPGVVSVAPRIAGTALFRARQAAVLGLPPGERDETLLLEEGRLIRKDGEMLLGAGLVRAGRYSLPLGVRVTVDPRHALAPELVGILKSTAARQDARLMVLTLDDAARLFGLGDRVTELAVACEAGKEEAVARGIYRDFVQTGRNPYLEVRTRASMQGEALRGLDQGVGAAGFALWLGLAVAVPGMLLTSGVELFERRRETAILKVHGFRTGEILRLLAYESLLLGILASVLSLLLALLWLRPLNGLVLARLLVPYAGLSPEFEVPFRFRSWVLGVAFGSSLVVSLTGTLLSAWRCAVALPARAFKGDA